MPIDAVKIPQNVQIEDKVVGPLSLRQIIIIAIGGGFSYVLYALVQKSSGHVGIPLTIALWVPAAIAAAFAMVNINDLSLLRICFLLLERTQKPGQRVWGPRQGISITIRTSNPPKEKPEASATTGPAKPTPQQQIAELSSVVDRAQANSSATPDISTGAPAGSPDTPNTEQDLSIDRPTSSLPKPPVNPARIQVDAKAQATSKQLSDLSVFRDIFPSTTSWPS